MSRTPVSEVRRQLGSAAVVSPSVAASWLPWDDRDAMDWLKSQGLILRVRAKRVVIWGDVLDRLRELEHRAEEPEPARRARTPTHQLRRLGLR